MTDTTRPLAQRILIAVTMIGGVLLLLVVFSGVLRTYRIPTGAMSPTLPVGCRVLVLRSKAAEHGRIVVFRYPVQRDALFVMRVVGIEGDDVQMRSKELFINGKKAVEPYAVHTDETIYPNMASLPEPYRSRDHFGPYRIPPGELFVLGDNRDSSSDSRYWGTVRRDDVIGHPVLVFSMDRGISRP